jgi:hypothetical protein
MTKGQAKASARLSPVPELLDRTPQRKLDQSETAIGLATASKATTPDAKA